MGVTSDISPAGSDAGTGGGADAEAERGRCYWVTFALGPNASLNADARELMKFDYSHPSENIDEKAGQPEIEETDSDGALTPVARSGHDEIPCPQSSGALSIRLLTITGSTGNRRKVSELGEGDLEIRVHAREVSEEELERQKQEREEALEKARKERIRRQLKECKKCESVKRRECSGDPGDCYEYMNCLGGSYADFCVLKG